MRTIFFVLLITLLVALWLPAQAFAHGSPEHTIEVAGDPQGSCPLAFELHMIMDHSGEHLHAHIGADRDLNGDGYICMKMLPNDLHLHVDNFIPVP